MNRNSSKALSPTPTPLSPSPLGSEVKSQSLVERVVTPGATESKPKPRPAAKSKPKAATPTPATASVSSAAAPSSAVAEALKAKMKQVKISSLLSGDEPTIQHTSSAPPAPTVPKKKSATPPVASALPLPNIMLASTKPTTAPTIKPVTSTANTTTTNSKAATPNTAKKAPTPSVKPALVRTKSNTSTTGGANATKKNSTAGASKASKSKSATALDSMKKKASSKKTSDADKKKVSDNTAASTTEPTKLANAPPIEKPDLLSTISKPKTASVKDSRISIVNIPLYPSSSNEYLDENGTVTFNLFQLLKEKELPGNIAESKAQKRKQLLADDHKQDASAEEGTDVDSADDMEDNEEGENGETKKSSEPKKKAHPMKGKNLIGKYDFEDPFIDDTEMLWEEQRASTKDGFFVFFGPLIAKGQSASFERANGTMKRGGIKK